MRKTAISNHPIAASLPYAFQTNEFSLKSWGIVDFYAQKDNVLILLEIEKGQKHPNTNVLKLWPYLESDSSIKIILIHVFMPQNVAPKNRVELCNFLGSKLENMFPKQFRYYKYNWSDITSKDLENIETKINELASI